MNAHAAHAAQQQHEAFVFGTCSVPIGRRGLWSIEHVTVTPIEARLNNLRAIMNAADYMTVTPGTYKRLRHAERGCVMSNTPMEVRTCRPAFDHAHGRVLVSGLGMGMVIEAMLAKPDVQHITVVELDRDVILLVGPHYLARAPGRLTILHGDAFAYEPERGERYDYAWHDVWDDISPDNLPSMRALKRKWARRIPLQECWTERELRATC